MQYRKVLPSVRSRYFLLEPLFLNTTITAVVGLQRYSYALHMDRSPTVDHPVTQKETMRRRCVVELREGTRLGSIVRSGHEVRARLNSKAG